MPQIPRAPSPCRRGGGAESGSRSPSSEGPPGAAELESRVLGSRAGPRVAPPQRARSRFAPSATSRKPRRAGASPASFVSRGRN